MKKKWSVESILEDPEVNRTIFYPRHLPKPTHLRSDCHIVEFSLSENITIGGFFFLRDPKLPTLMIFHGNGEIAADYEYNIGEFLNNGVNCAIIDFRGYGFSTGIPTYKNLLEDAYQAFLQFSKWLKARNFSSKVIVMGRSLGSACAAEIGSYHPPNLAGIIFESGFCDTYRLFKYLFGIDDPSLTAQTLEPWSNFPRIAKIDSPVLILHGMRDYIIPFEHARLIDKTLPPSTPRTLVAIEHAGHNNIQGFKDQYFTALKTFISSKLYSAS